MKTPKPTSEKIMGKTGASSIPKSLPAKTANAGSIPKHRPGKKA